MLHFYFQKAKLVDSFGSFSLFKKVIFDKNYNATSAIMNVAL